MLAVVLKKGGSKAGIAEGRSRAYITYVDFELTGKEPQKANILVLTERDKFREKM